MVQIFRKCRSYSKNQPEIWTNDPEKEVTQCYRKCYLLYILYYIVLYYIILFIYIFNYAIEDTNKDRKLHKVIENVIYFIFYIILYYIILYCLFKVTPMKKVMITFQNYQEIDKKPEVYFFCFIGCCCWLWKKLYKIYQLGKKLSKYES